MLVLGLGNVLLTDDGVGVVAVERLRAEWELPETVRALDGGTLGLALLGYFDGADHVILIDAIRSDGAAPGTLVRLEGDDVEPAVRHRLSPHQIGVADLLDSLRLLDRLPPRITLLGLVPGSLALGIELSPEVQAGVPALVEALAAELRDAGHAAVRRRRDGCTVHLADRGDPARFAALR